MYFREHESWCRNLRKFNVLPILSQKYPVLIFILVTVFAFLLKTVLTQHFLIFEEGFGNIYRGKFRDIENTKSIVSPPRDLCPPADDGAAPREVSNGHQVPGPHRVVRQGDQGQLGHYVLLLFLKNSGNIYWHDAKY